MKSTGRLNKEQRKYFDKLVKAIGPENLTEADVFWLETGAEVYATMKRAEAEKNEKGETQTFKNGTVQVSAYYTIWQKSVSAFEDFVNHFGLSPKARKGLGLNEEVSEKPKDPVAGLRKVG